MTTPQPSPLDDPVEVCTHEDERGSTVMRVRDDRWECAVCGVRFRLTLDAARAASPDGGLLDRIREEVREAVIEGDAQDCSSPDCIADAVYEIVRVALASPAASPDGGLRAALDWLRRAIDGRCSNPRCPSEHEGDAPDCVEFHLAAVEALASSAPAGLDDACDWTYVRMLGFYCSTHGLPSYVNPPTHDAAARPAAPAVTDDGIPMCGICGRSMDEHDEGSHSAAPAGTDDGEYETCPTCWQPVPVPQRGDHDYGIPLRATAPAGLDVERLRIALHEAGIGCKPNVPYCRATHRGHAQRIADQYRPGAVVIDGGPIEHYWTDRRAALTEALHETCCMEYDGFCGSVPDDIYARDALLYLFAHGWELQRKSTEQETGVYLLERES